MIGTLQGAARGVVREVSFGELFTRVERKITLEEDATYPTVGVRWYGKGAFVRRRLLGADIARKQQWVIQRGDLVYNKLFAWKGAFAIADSSVDGYIVSDKFPTYGIDSDRVDADYLTYFLRSPALADQALRLSKGAAAISKLTLNPPQFWDLTVPLPGMDAQRELARRLSALDERLVGLEELRHASEAAADALMPAVLGEAFAADSRLGHLRDVLIDKPRNGWSPICDNSESGVPVLALGAVTGFKYRASHYKRTSAQTEHGANYWLEKGDLLITRSNTPDLVGHAAIYDGEPAPCIYPDLMMRIKVDSEMADVRFVHYWLQSRPVRRFIASTSRGTSPTMKKIAQGDVMGIPFPIELPLSDQANLVRRFERIEAQAEDLRLRLKSDKETYAALAASALDAAFAISPDQN